MELSDIPATRQRRLLTAVKPSPTAIIIAAGILAAALKIYCAATTFGSCDVPIIYRFGQIVDAFGLDYMYRLDRHFNHPPITGEFFGLLYHFSAWLTPPTPHAVPRSFPFLLRLPSIIADALALLVVLRAHQKTGKPPVGALILFALSPVAFMVSGFHGNVDPIMVCLLLMATYFCVEESVLLSALFLALACGIKIIPLFLVPAFFFFWLNRGGRSALKFAVIFGCSCLAVWSEALIDSPSYFFRNVLGYSSYAGGWGITYWCVFFLEKFHFDISPQALNRLGPLLTALKVVVVALAIGLGWFRRKQSAMGFLGTVALCWICFAIFAPGFIPYYLVWMAPFVLLYSATWYALLTAASSIYLFAYYNMMSHGMPWNASDSSVPPAWNNWGTIPWFVLVGIALSALVNWRSVPRRIADGGLSQSAKPQIAQA
ncbi:MAG TPA: glycosyltransferase 87 family protein [Chthoniobacterales bacterium]|nr:glycosyltransferase 87 family protein [Chthoniobacterales bacterium]